jgi:putative phosphoesterase
MRIAALYDIHGNLPALDVVLAEIDRLSVDAIVVGGDVVPGPMPAEALDRLSALTVPTHFIAGNGEHDVLTCLAGGEPARVPEQYREIVRWTARQLRPEHARAIAQWPLTSALAVGGLGSVLFCHATPRDDNEIFTRNTPDGALAPVLEGLDIDLLVCGHTHMQFDRAVGAVRIVNAGSVGMPFGEPGAHWLLLDGEIQLRRTPYDPAGAAYAIRRTDYPDAPRFAEMVATPPTEWAMLEAFDRAAIGHG